MPSRPIFIINARGEKEPFSFQKAYRSAKFAGAPDELAQDIAEAIQAEVYPEMKTSEIFKRIKKLLSQRHPHSAIKFSLKEGMRKLGPSGFPFENYVQAILTRHNFWVEEAQIISGRCTHHEIDFLAYDQSKPTSDFPFRGQDIFYVGECKYHRRPGARVDLDIALAYYALFLDIKEGALLKKPKFIRLEAKPILVTNTKFTRQAIEYASCVGVNLLGWKYPPGKGLEVLIDRQRLYPLTVLPSVSRDDAEALFSQKIVLVEDILKANLEKLAQRTEISRQKLNRIIEEAKLLEK